MEPRLAEKVQHYLYYNYVPEHSDLLWIHEVLEFSESQFAYSPEGAASILDNVCDRLFGAVSSNGLVVVPLSGGYDSRILFGAAIERFDRTQIKAMSFGAPGQLDYDIGSDIARKFGIEHFAVDLNEVKLNWEGLRDSVCQSPWTYVPDGFYMRHSFEQVAQSNNDIIVTGFLGDSLTGGHISAAKKRDEVVNEFISKQRREKSLWLACPGYDPNSVIPVWPEDSTIPGSELLDFGLRQASCIAPIVTPQKIWQTWGGDTGKIGRNGATVLAPYAHPQWAKYWFSVPKNLKINQRLYIEMMHYKFPSLAKMPSKYTLGVKPEYQLAYRAKKSLIRSQLLLSKIFGISYTSPTTNYINFAEAFRSRDDYKAILDHAISFLKDREVVPWLDCDLIKDEHMMRRKNSENALLILLGLALNLEVNEKKGDVHE